MRHDGGDPDQDGGRLPFATSLIAIAVAGTAIRVGYTIALGQHVELGISDATFYSGAANHLAAGDGYVDIWRSIAENGVGGELLRTAHHPPGWPAVVSIASLLGVESQLGHRLVGAVIGGVVVVLLGLLARRVAGRQAGLLAAGIGAVHPSLVAADGSLMSETLAGAVVLVVLLVSLSVLERPSTRLVLLLGVLVGAAALVRGEGLLYVVLVALPVTWISGRRAKLPTRAIAARAAVLLAGVAVVVLPWTVRNTLLLDRVVLISINGSTVLAGANCPSTYSGPGLGSWDVDCVVSPGGDEAEEAAVWRRQGLEHLESNLDRLPAVVGARLARTWGLWSPLSANAEGRHAPTQTAGNVVWLLVLLPAGTAGAFVVGRHRPRIELWIVLSPVVAATTVTVVGFGMLRFRHGIELAAIVLAGASLARLFPGVVISADALVPHRHRDGDPRGTSRPAAGPGRR